MLPDSPAEGLDIRTGEILAKVNGLPVTTKDALHAALQANPAYCKLEIINLQGESRFAGRAIFAGEHHQLGILICPDEDTRYVVEERQQQGLVSVLARSLVGLFDKKQGSSDRAM
ncbi:Cell division topological determinant MinJ [compost metagenome]